MNLSRSFIAKLFLPGLLITAAACEDQIPTAAGRELFPGDLRPITVEVELAAESFLDGDTTFTGFTRAFGIGYVLVANNFGGGAADVGLDSHALIRFGGFPDSVSYTRGGTQQTDTSFVYGPGSLVLSRDTFATRVDQPVTLRVYALEQAWDANTTTWFLASDTAGAPVPWRQPGGTLGALLAETTLIPGDTLMRDSVVWQLDSVAVNRMARDGFPGFAITAAGAPARVQLRGARIRTAVHPASLPDTALAQTIALRTETFIFTPQPPVRPDLFTVGGVTASRTVFRFRVPREVPGCPVVQGTTCAAIALRDVALNDATLLLDPVVVPLAFRPLGPVPLVLRRVLEPELGSRAPLGNVVARDTVSAAVFAEGGLPFRLELTGYVQAAAANDSVATTLALLAEPEGGTFGVALFQARPRLRLTYTLPRRLSLP